MGARHEHGHTMSKKKRAGGGVVKLPSIIALDVLNCGAKLDENKGEKMGEGRKCVRLKAEGKRP